MAIANYFYNQTTRKYVAIFGTLFNQLKIQRKNSAGATIQSFVVPIAYGPYQKFLAKLNDNSTSQRSAITLPRMSFDITSISYDSARKIANTMKLTKTTLAEDDDSRKMQYAPSPYNLEFNLYIMTKYSEDATKIVEQILPFFNPEWVTTANIISGLEPLDIPLILNSVTQEEIYEGDFTERRSVMWTLSFTMKGWYFGPEKKKKVIKFVDTDLYNDPTAGDTINTANSVFMEGLNVQPGLDNDGNPVYQQPPTATATAAIANGQVISTTIVQNGENYDANTTVTFSAPDVITATATANVANGSVTSIDVTEAGGYYTVAPTVTVSDPEEDFVTATATATVANDAISSITVTNSGNFYNSATVTISDPPAKADQVKFGNDALAYNADTDVTQIGTMPNIITMGPGPTGFKVDFWIYPTSFPGGQAISVMYNSNFKIYYNATTGLLGYQYKGFAGVTSNTLALNLNAWNHVRLTHINNQAQFGVNGQVAPIYTNGAGDLNTAGEAVFAGDDNAGVIYPSANRGFVGYLDSVSFNEVTIFEPNSFYFQPNAHLTGDIFDNAFEAQVATATANVVNGEVVSIDITSGGANYANANPTVTISDPDAARADFAAQVNVELTDGGVSAINITDGGNFYANTANVAISAPTATTATGTVNVTQQGDVGSITITDAGLGYRNAPSVTISTPPDASIPYTDIEFDDNWGIMKTIVDE